MESLLDRPCSRCGAPVTLYFYPRSGPAPGNMIVCTDPKCDASVEAGQRRLEADLGHFAASQSDFKN